MTTAQERKAKREERLQKELQVKMARGLVWKTMKFIGAYVGYIAVIWWLAVVMQEHPRWAITIAWIMLSLVIGAVLFQKAAK